MSAVSKILAALLVSIFIVRDLAADDMQIAVSIRYLQIKGTSHAHIYLYTGDGKLIRQLTRDQTGQDVDPVFAPEGREIVFTRKAKTGDQTWSVTTLGTGAHRVSAVPAWYQNKTEDTPRFTFLSMEWERWYKNLPEDGASPSPSPTSTPRPFKLVAPDGSVELILNSTGDNQKDYEEEQRGKLYRLRDLKSGEESLIGDWPGFETIWDPLHLRKEENSYFLIQPPLRTIFFFRHLNSTDGDTVYALDLNQKHVVRLSPNYATPIPVSGEPIFFTVAEERYLPLGDGKRTVNCSYLDRWDADFRKIRYARSSPAIFGGASVFRSGKLPLTIPANISQ
jgi:dipeptidyl aminopeptidase/acylaminoacyl peptidase